MLLAGVAADVQRPGLAVGSDVQDGAYDEGRAVDVMQ